MENLIKDYGWCQIVQQDNRYYIYYDGGGVVVQMKKIEITKEQANKALINQFKAEEVIRDILEM